MFDPPSHEVVQDKHNTFVSNPSNNNENLAKCFGTLFTSPNENKPLQKSFMHNMGRTSSTFPSFIQDKITM
jgi:hypothetical protein